MKRRKFYVCDGKVPKCKKTYCGFNGTGECMHTEDKEHARYDSHDDWSVKFDHGRTLFFEKVR